MIKAARRLRRAAGSLGLLLTLALVAGLPGRATPTREHAPLSQQARLEIFETVWRDIRDLYYDPAFHGVNWEQIHEQYLPKARAATDEDDFYAIVRRMTGELHDAHTRFYSPQQWRRIKQHEHAGLGFTATQIEGKAVITAVENGSDAQRAGIQPGTIVLTVDGKPIAERIAEAAAKREPSSSERADQLFVFRDVFSAPLGASVKLGLARADGSTFDATLTAQIYPNVPTVESRLLPSGEAYIEFDGFNHKTAKEFKAALQKYRSAPGLVVDLRWNGGGELEPVVAIAGYFLNDKTLIAKYSTRSGKPIAWLGGLVKLKLDVEAGERGRAIYSGPVTLLVGPRTASASEIFSGGMQEIGRVKVIGTQTCGCVLGITKPREMKGGGVLEISESVWMTPKGRKLEGTGIVPDKIVAATIADIQQKRDPALAEAAKALQQSQPAASTPEPSDSAIHDQLLTAIPEVTSQRYCYGDAETFTVWLKLRVRYVNGSTKTLILDKEIGTAWYGEKVARSIEDLAAHKYEYNPNIDWLSTDTDKEDNQPSRASPGPDFAILAPRQAFERKMDVRVVAQYENPKQFTGTIRPGLHVLQIELSAWNHPGSASEFEKQWRKSGQLVTGVIKTEPLEIRVPSDPRVEKDCN